MIVALVVLSAAGGMLAYVGLPKEGSPNIDIPILYVSVPLPGVSAEDSERLLVRPLESKLRSAEGLKEMTGIATENHAGVLLEFDFGWDKSATVADVRALVDEAQSEFPAEAEEPTITEVNLSAFPILVVTLSGDAPERALMRLAKSLQREIEALTPVLEVGLAGYREEMIEVVIDPLQLEAYDVTAQELLTIVSSNNALVPAGAVESETGRFSVRLPGNFRDAADIYRTPVRVDGDRVVTIADIATINRTFEDEEGTARFNGERTVALQVKKRFGENIIDTVALVKQRVEEVRSVWPEALRASVTVGYSMDQSVEVQDMVAQLEGSVLTAVVLVMVVVVLTLGARSAALVGVTIPLSFLLTFALLAVFGMSVNNMVMFGLILAVGMLVDGGIVVTEYADRLLSEGAEPETAYREAARRMFWPIVSSTATTLCAFLPMLFWPGMPGQFMGQLPITLIFVLSASLIVALIYLPVLGAALGRAIGGRRRRPAPPSTAPARRTLFGALIAAIVMNPVGPVIGLGAAGLGVYAIYAAYAENNRGTEFFVAIEPQRAILYVRARGNLSLAEKDALVAQVERRVTGIEGVSALFAFAGDGGLQKAGGDGPRDAIGQIQIELAPWGQRPDGRAVLAEIQRRAQGVPGVIVELQEQQEGPQQGKPIQVRLEGTDWGAILSGAETLNARLQAMEGLREVGDTRPLPGIDWELVVDREAAGRFGADIRQIGAIVQLATRGAMLDTIRPDDSEEELEIRARFPEPARALATLEGLKMRTAQGMVPLGNFVTIRPADSLAEISRHDGLRFVVVEADVAPGVNVNEQIAQIAQGLVDDPLPNVRPVFQGDQEEQAESMSFLGKAMLGALGLMFAILLAQFNSLYGALLVLSAVVLSVAGVLLGMLVMDQTFSIIMTGTGIVALAGIVVNNNIILIDTYQDFSKSMPPLEAIVRTAEQRIRPVLLTTITTMAGLTPMMFAASVDFTAFGPGFGALTAAGPFTAAGWSAFLSIVAPVGQPTALWWVQLATAVVFGLGVATVLTLVVTPAALALRIWWGRLLDWIGDRLALRDRVRRLADRQLRAQAARTPAPEILFDATDAAPPAAYPPRAYADAAE
jgi:multidrug efflux pump